MIQDIYDIKTKDEVDPFRSPGQKEQGREKKNKARQKDGFENRSNQRRPPPPPKKHTPGREHQKYSRIYYTDK